MTCLKHAAAALCAVFLLTVPAAAQYSVADRYPHLEARKDAPRAAKRPKKVRKVAKARKPIVVASLTPGDMLSEAPVAPARPETIPTPFGTKIPVNKSLAGYPAPLANKALEIVRDCGSRIVSTYRPGARVRGSGRPSLHASKRAVDVAGNPECIRRKLAGWRGGVSTDYGAVHHYHFSYAPGGREWGSRFKHWKPRRHARR